LEGVLVHIHSCHEFAKKFPCLSTDRGVNDDRLLLKGFRQGNFLPNPRLEWGILLERYMRARAIGGHCWGLDRIHWAIAQWIERRFPTRSETPPLLK
jgi:hypothetical protein